MHRTPPIIKESLTPDLEVVRDQEQQLPSTLPGGLMLLQAAPAHLAGDVLRSEVKNWNAMFTVRPFISDTVDPFQVSQGGDSSYLEFL